jgi:hypothetical protein
MGFVIGAYARYLLIHRLISGVGLLYNLQSDTPIYLQEVYIVISGLGIGPLFQTPIQALQAATPVSQMAASSVTLLFLRAMGLAIGITIGGTILNNQLPQRLAFTGYQFSISEGLGHVGELSEIQPVSLRLEVLNEFALYNPI